MTVLTNSQTAPILDFWTNGDPFRLTSETF